MHSLRKESFIRRWVSTISLLLLFQGFFPAQLHSELVKDSNGQLVEVCTLHGFETITLDANGHPVDDQSQNDNQRSPAMVFSELMAETVTDVTVLIVFQQDVPSFSFPTLHTVVIPEVNSGLMPIRAPPVA